MKLGCFRLNEERFCDGLKHGPKINLGSFAQMKDG